MTSPALPGAAPDPARLPPEVEEALSFALADAPARGTCDELLLRTAIARALGGDGEPVAWALKSPMGRLYRKTFPTWEDAEGAAQAIHDRDGEGARPTVVPLYTRPAATGDTGEVERARADFLAWVNAGYLVRDAVTDVEWDDEGLPLYYTRNDGERHYLDGEWHAWLAAKGVNCG